LQTSLKTFLYAEFSHILLIALCIQPFLRMARVLDLKVALNLDELQFLCFS